MWRTSSYSDSRACVEAGVLPPSWRKSTASMSNGDCVEAASWRKSTASGPDHDCVEVGRGATVTVVRDSKDPGGAWLAVSPAAWTAFTARLKTGPRQA